MTTGLLEAKIERLEAGPPLARCRDSLSIADRSGSGRSRLSGIDT